MPSCKADNPYAAPQTESPRPSRLRLSKIFDGMVGGVLGASLARLWMIVLPDGSPGMLIVATVLSALIAGYCVFLLYIIADD